MTPDRGGVTDADSIVLPFTLTVPSLETLRKDGVSRLDPVKIFPAKGWPRAQSADSSAPFSLFNWLGIAAARAQGIPPEEEEIARRGASARLLTAAEEFRLELYHAATRRLFALDPDNLELRGIATQDYVPDESALARRQAAVAEAERKARGAERVSNPPPAVKWPIHRTG